MIGVSLDVAQQEMRMRWGAVDKDGNGYPREYRKAMGLTPTGRVSRKHSCRELAARRKCRELAAGPGWTKGEWGAFVVTHGSRCLRCGDDDCALVPDHVVPLIKGGGHDLSNIQPLCNPCNIWKGIKVVDFR